MKRTVLAVSAAVLGMTCSAAWAYDGGPVTDGGSITGTV